MAKLVPEPPILRAIVDVNTGRLDEQWQAWFTQLQSQVTAGRQVVTAAANINQGVQYVDMTVTSGTYAVTLAAPSEPGLFLMMEAVTVSGGGTITMSLTNCTGGTASTTCTWNSTGDNLVLMSRSNKWVIIKQDGVTLT